MCHSIEFRVDYEGDREISPRHHLERVLLRKGTRLRTQIKPYVVGSDDNLIEVADLYVEDGTIMRRVPFASFAFVD